MGCESLQDFYNILRIFRLYSLFPLRLARENSTLRVLSNNIKKLFNLQKQQNIFSFLNKKLFFLLIYKKKK